MGLWPFADRVEKKKHSPQLLQHSDVQKAYAIQPVGSSRGQGKGVQMCESPRAMRQPCLWTTWPTLGAGHKFGTVYCCTGWCTGSFGWCVSVYSTLNVSFSFMAFMQTLSLNFSGCVWMRCNTCGLETKVSSSAWNTVRWVSTHLTILSLLYLMNYSAQDAIREGDCFLSAITTEYTV